MALAARKLADQQPLPEMAPEPVAAPFEAPQIAFEPQGWASSPARDLQQQLNQAFGDTADQIEIEGKWSARRSMVFVVGASTVLWAAIIGGVALLLG